MVPATRRPRRRGRRGRCADDPSRRGRRARPGLSGGGRRRAGRNGPGGPASRSRRSGDGHRRSRPATAAGVREGLPLAGQSRSVSGLALPGGEPSAERQGDRLRSLRPHGELDPAGGAAGGDPRRDRPAAGTAGTGSGRRRSRRTASVPRGRFGPRSGSRDGRRGAPRTLGPHGGGDRSGRGRRQGIQRGRSPPLLRPADGRLAGSARDRSRPPGLLQPSLPGSRRLLADVGIAGHRFPLRRVAPAGRIAAGRAASRRPGHHHPPGPLPWRTEPDLPGRPCAGRLGVGLPDHTGAPRAGPATGTRTSRPPPG